MNINKLPVMHLPNALFRDLGWDYFISPEAQDYLTSDIVLIHNAEQVAYYEAANRLYDMYTEAAQHIIDNRLWDELAIPPNLRDIIRLTWEDDRQLHLYGRFDFAGGVGHLPIKLLEFNADTATSIPETAIIQWAQLKANNLDEKAQFNNLYDALVANFKRLKQLNSDMEATMLFSTLRDAPEDEHNVSLLAEAAHEAGFETEFRYIDEITFSAEEGIFADYGEGKFARFAFWFKLLPWEYVAYDEPELADLLTSIVRHRHAVILNPAYTLLFQSKGIMKYLWELYPDDPLLLHTDTKPIAGAPDTRFVRKVMLGREGANVSIYNGKGEDIESNGGEYGNYPNVYQAYALLAQDDDHQFYQAGVFFAWEACGLGFRRSKSRIIDNASQFVGHMVDA